MAGPEAQGEPGPAPLTMEDIEQLGIMNGHMVNDRMPDDLTHEERNAAMDGVRMELGLIVEQFRHDNTTSEDDDTV